MPEHFAASGQEQPAPSLLSQVEARLARRITGWKRPDTGLSAATRLVITLDSGDSVFIKAAADTRTESWLQTERLALEHAPPGLAPEIIDWFESESGYSVLIVRALDGHWPASHRGVDWHGGLKATIQAIERLSNTPGPEVFTAAGSSAGEIRWNDPAVEVSVIGAGIASARWFGASRAALLSAEATLDRSGSAFVHGDMRSDNICLMPDGPRFVDWSFAARGAVETDLAGFLPAARLEGGPAPENILPRGGSWAAAQAAQMAAMATGGANPAWLRRVCWRLTAINLDWAVASLGLDRRDGPLWENL